ncbi:MAG: ATP-binding protein, partial [Candidatus Stygibacter australis]|nr:ATP-binding protein [Candidatus Stygibacter australis]
MTDNNYNASNIKVLKGLEAVRKRPAMYIGGTTERGLHHLIYEVVDNSIDEALGGYCDQIDVILHRDGYATIIDNGRGIPVEMHKIEKIPAVEVVMTVLHAGGKFDNKSYKVSGGLHGVGVSVVNALSEKLEVYIKKNGKRYFQRYSKGIPETGVEVLEEGLDPEKTGTMVRFIPDSTIFETTTFSFDYLSVRLRELAFLNRGLKISLKDERTEKTHVFKYDGGIIEFVAYLNTNKKPLAAEPLFIEGGRDDIQFEVALQYNESYQENILSFANNINT